MEDPGAILCQISYLKDMLDQVNEEIEANIQITREIESEIVKCSEFESALAAKESDLTRTLYVSQFELIGLVTVTNELRRSVENLERELDGVRLKREEILERISENRERFVALCMEFQEDIDDKGSDNVLRALLSEKEYLQNEMLILDEKNNALKNSMMAFIEGILEDLNSGNSALQIEIQKGNQENEKLLKDINNMKTSWLSNFSYDDISGAGSWTLQ
ncbi:PREDICTED: uncharacterized protein LOC101292601 [Fragaria vesca subsp. vesca]|uniref:uncharacterized protein LOC101292601 n=1 Tax=Fragaria vesca subsp. vesca TaxID=101020 RepID=UPI0002C35C4A|nr:PREDICTED: uncharacterized protein LOC101292601 [Fragaria vesca subsp. vesca]XP_011464244.1 PREDICTED: uncharacterized protein LOC101292601 [Fragaria vesca subsp. vesca]